MKNNKNTLSSELFIFLDRPMNKKQEFVEYLLKRIPYRKSIGYAGHDNKLNLKKFLMWSIYGKEKEIRWKDLNREEVRKVIEETLNLCKSAITEEIKIFVFPTINNFVIKKMRGVSGFTPWKNTILLNIHYTNEWKVTLKETVGHELAHALALNFNKRSTIQDDLISEGIAEHFREHFIGGKKAEWVKSITKEEAKKINTLKFEEHFIIICLGCDDKAEGIEIMTVR